MHQEETPLEAGLPELGLSASCGERFPAQIESGTPQTSGS